MTESDKEHIAILFQKDITTNFGVKFGSFSDTLEDLKYFVKCETILVQLGTSINEILNLRLVHILSELSSDLNFSMVITLIKLGANPIKPTPFKKRRGRTVASYLQECFDDSSQLSKQEYTPLIPYNIAVLRSVSNVAGKISKTEKTSQVFKELEENLCKASYKPEEARQTAEDFLELMEEFVKAYEIWVSNFKFQQAPSRKLAKPMLPSKKKRTFQKQAKVTGSFLQPPRKPKESAPIPKSEEQIPQENSKGCAPSSQPQQKPAQNVPSSKLQKKSREKYTEPASHSKAQQEDQETHSKFRSFVEKIKSCIDKALTWLSKFLPTNNFGSKLSNVGEIISSSFKSQLIWVEHKLSGKSR